MNNTMKEVEKKLRKSELKDANNISGGDEDFLEGVYLFSSLATPNATPSERILRWQQGLPEKDDRLEDILHIVERIEVLNDGLKTNTDLSFKMKRLHNIMDTIEILGYSVDKMDDFPDNTFAEECSDIEIFSAIDMEINEAISKLYELTCKVNDYTKKAIAEKNLGHIFISGLVFYGNVLQNADIITSEFTNK